MYSLKTHSIGVLVTVAWLMASAFALQLSEQSVRDFAVRLAVNGVPAGVVAREAVLAATGTPPKADPRGRSAFRAELPRLIADFNKDSNNVRAIEADGVIHVEGAALPDVVKELLGREVFIEGAETPFAGDAIFKRLVGLIRQASVTALAGIGTMPDASCRLGEAVHISRGTYTVTSYLDRIVSQLPGIVWLVTYDPERPNHSLKLGVVCPDGGSLKMDVYQ